MQPAPRLPHHHCCIGLGRASSSVVDPLDDYGVDDRVEAFVTVNGCLEQLNRGDRASPDCFGLVLSTCEGNVHAF